MNNHQKYPEKEGIKSLWLTTMMNRWEEQLCHVHAYAILRNGNLVAEAYKYPYTKDSRRLVNSVSKTLTAIAVGIAEEEGYISIEDKVISFFPDYNQTQDEFLRELSIAHLLTMSTGHKTDSIDSIYTKDKTAWEAFLDTAIENKPGTKFTYDSSATYMLSKILTIVTNEKLVDYLQLRLFEPLGFTDVDWDEIDGTSTGGWGCIISLHGMAKIGQMILQKGEWEGKQLVPRQWIEKMSAFQIATDESNVLKDWQQGYGYQMWQCSRYGCFRADGAFGQYILVLPPKNMTVAIWSEDAFSQDMLDIFWEEVYDKIDDRKYGIDGNACEIYHKKCIEWSTPLVMKPTYSYKEEIINDREYRCFDHGTFANEIQFSFYGCGQMRLSIINTGAVSAIYADNTCLHFGSGIMNFETASFIRFGRKRNEIVKYAASYQWVSDNALKIKVYWLETSHTTEISCLFGADKVAVVLSASYRKLLMEVEDTPAIFNSDQWFIGNQMVHA